MIKTEKIVNGKKVTYVRYSDEELAEMKTEHERRQNEFNERKNKQ